MQKMEIPNFGQNNLTCDFRALAVMQADTVNRSPGELKGYDCPKCMNRGFSMAVREDNTLVAQVCSCMNIRKNVHKMERSGLDSVIREKTMDSFRAEEAWQKKIRDTAKHFAADPSGWLLMCGQPGSGKTHLCTAVCRELLLRGMQVCYMSWRDEISGLKDFRAEGEKRTRRMGELKNAQVLYVDDLFKTGGALPTDMDLSLAFELLNHRYIHHGITIVSTEKTPEELIALDEALGSRMIEAAREHICVIRPDRKRNYRLRGLVV